MSLNIEIECNFDLSDDSGMYLADAISCLPSLEQLSLMLMSCRGLSNLSIMHMLKFLPRLRKLDLVLWMTAITDTGVIGLADTMTQTPQLESCAIRLDNTSITDIAVTKLLDTLSLLPLLQRLYLTLGGCSVTNTTGDKLAALLKYKETLIDFDVSLELSLIHISSPRDS
eukprot:TRINITY_DN2628_c0_g1_i1.p1 TRINITY_DN2628_c0_g1~~TRINITY_DN2628_c0_g1_i1.p1  ORF type:complete len:170 (+),score=9.04 TRINITY_DN2628_c0_g1_i1:413-922(+)